MSENAHQTGSHKDRGQRGKTVILSEPEAQVAGTSHGSSASNRETTPIRKGIYEN